MIDPVDAMMEVMDLAFDPAFGEAWTRRQVSDALLNPRTFVLLADETGEAPATANAMTCGFAMSRQTLDEEELLLIAVSPDYRGKGIGARLLARLAEQAANRGTVRLMLEMREGNRAVNLYQRFGFVQIGRRKGYYRSTAHGPLDALTFSFDF